MAKQPSAPDRLRALFSEPSPQLQPAAQYLLDNPVWQR